MIEPGTREDYYAELEKGLVWVELGVETGINASNILKSADPSRLYLIDPWTKMEKNECPWVGVMDWDLDAQYADVCEQFGENEKVEVIRKRSSEAVVAFEDESVDVVFVDANHTHEYCLRDAREWFEKLRPGGFLLFHDYVEDGYKFGVVSAVTEFVETTPDAEFLGKTREGFCTAIVRKEAK
jgi:SAM-dependent methyltransferase